MKWILKAQELFAQPEPMMSLQPGSIMSFDYTEQNEQIAQAVYDKMFGAGVAGVEVPTDMKAAVNCLHDLGIHAKSMTINHSPGHVSELTVVFEAYAIGKTITDPSLMHEFVEAWYKT